ncbi:MAG TPA: hypothetical protein VK993_07450 [Chthoniobacterales bacterium]|nr:hypothetical protein [Chthoniobacterales bacterium]
MKTLKSSLAAFFAFFALTNAEATTVIPPSFDELVDQAQLIFQGTVSDTQSQWAGEGASRRIVTYVTFNVEEAIKGEPGATYTLRMLGGTVDGQTMEVTDSPKFKVGDRDIVFVENNGSQFIPLVGIMHGRYRVQQDKAGKDVVTTNSGHALTDVAAIGKDDDHGHANAGTTQSATAASVEQALGTADFKSAIRDKLAKAGQ